MKVNFRIEKKNLNDKKSNIRLDFTYSGKRGREEGRVSLIGRRAYC